MNYHQAIKNYKDNDILSQVEGGSKHDFIKIILYMDHIYRDIKME